MNNLQRLVLDFMEAKGQGDQVANWTDGRVLSKRLIREEIAELSESLEKNKPTIEIIKEACDVMYVAIGALNRIGVDLDIVFDKVHASNMSKTPGTLDSGGKLMKGPDYFPPDLSLEYYWGAKIFEAENNSQCGYYDEFEVNEFYETRG